MPGLQTEMIRCDEAGPPGRRGAGRAGASVRGLPDASGSRSPVVFPATPDAGGDCRAFQHSVTGYLTGGGGGSDGPDIRHAFGEGAGDCTIEASFCYVHGFGGSARWRITAHELGPALNGRPRGELSPASLTPAC